MRHTSFELTCFAEPVQLLSPCVVLTTTIGPLVPSPCFEHLTPASLMSALVRAVNLTTIARGADDSLSAAIAAVEEPPVRDRPLAGMTATCNS